MLFSFHFWPILQPFSSIPFPHSLKPSSSNGDLSTTTTSSSLSSNGNSSTSPSTNSLNNMTSTNLSSPTNTNSSLANSNTTNGTRPYTDRRLVTLYENKVHYFSKTSKTININFNFWHEILNFEILCVFKEFVC